MKDEALNLGFAREEQRLKVSWYERSEEGENTLRPYEVHEVAWAQVDSASVEVIRLLARFNKRTGQTPAILDGLRKSGQLLFDSLIPLRAKEKLAGTTSQALTLHIDDSLVHIPWELLYDGREFLCCRFAIGRVASTRQIPTARSVRTLKQPFRVLIVADPRGDLPASYQEGMEIRAFLDERRDAYQVDFKSDRSIVAFVKKNLRDYDIVHYAGHARYHPENPSESGWLLTDGALKASEISAMGGLQPMPSLVFSNACQSGQSGVEGSGGHRQQIFGLANAHLLSGVQHYIGTFWEILDEPGSEFAKQFYHLLGQGDEIGQAVRKAREKLIENFGEETIVWASYMLYGDPTFSFTAHNENAFDNRDDTNHFSDRVEPRHAEPDRCDARQWMARRRPILPYVLCSVLAVAIVIAAIGFLSQESQPEMRTTSPAGVPDIPFRKSPDVKPA